VSYGLLVKPSIPTISNEIVSIFAWVFIWESCDRFVFERFNIGQKSKPAMPKWRRLSSIFGF
jgi:hypothetical protein